MIGIWRSHVSPHGPEKGGNVTEPRSGLCATVFCAAGKQPIYKALTIRLHLVRGILEHVMKTTALTVFMLSCLAIPTHAGCEDSKAYFLNEKALPEKADSEIEAKDFESTDGASYFIYLNADKKPDRIVRIDFGEMGRNVTKLIVGTPTDVMLESSKEFYNVPYTMPGSFTVRRESVFYFFCNGKLQQESEADPNSEYAKSAKIVAESFFGKSEIKKELEQSGIKPLVWE
jgi:hypothetical protein